MKDAVILMLKIVVGALVGAQLAGLLTVIIAVIVTAVARYHGEFGPGFVAAIYGAIILMPAGALFGAFVGPRLVFRKHSPDSNVPKGPPPSSSQISRKVESARAEVDRTNFPGV